MQIANCTFPLKVSVFIMCIIHFICAAFFGYVPYGAPISADRTELSITTPTILLIATPLNKSNHANCKPYLSSEGLSFHYVHYSFHMRCIFGYV